MLDSSPSLALPSVAANRDQYSLSLLVGDQAPLFLATVLKLTLKCV
jgi:hypothetical protein